MVNPVDISAAPVDMLSQTVTTSSAVVANENEGETTMISSQMMPNCYESSFESNPSTGPLCGQEKHCEDILRAYRRIGRKVSSGSGNVANTKLSRSEIVLISGSSGSGKSALLESACSFMESAFIVKIKNDQVLTGLSMTLTNMLKQMDKVCELVSTSPEFDSERRTQFMDAIGQEDARVLERIFPSFHLVSGTKAPEQGTDMAGYAKEGNDVGESYLVCQGMPSIRRIIPKFFSLLSSPSSPIVLCFEDLHWIEEKALQKITDLIFCDLYPSHVLTVCTYHDQHPSAGIIEAYADPSRRDITCTWVKMGALGETCCSRLLARILRLSADYAEHLQPLVRILHTKSKGSPLMTLHLVAMLQEKGLLVRSESVGWTWDLEQVQKEMDEYKDVSELMDRKLKRVDPSLLKVLQLASCLGYEFDVESLQLVVHHMKSHFSQGHGVAVDSILEAAVSDRLIAKGHDDGWYRFAHDHIHRALYTSISMDTPSRLHLKIGQIMRDQSMKSQADFFNSLHHMNLGSENLKTVKERATLAEMNLRAGKMLKSMYAYVGAAQAFETGSRLVEDQWTAYYKLCLDLNTMWADMVRFNRQYDLCDKIVGNILQKARNPRDMLAATCIKVDTLGMRGRVSQACSVGFETLRLNKERVPLKPNIGHLAIEFGRARRLIKDLSNEQLLSLPRAVDKRELLLHNLYILVVTYLPLRSDETRQPFLLLRALQSAIRSGVSLSTPHALTMYGMFQSTLGNFADAYRFGKLAGEFLTSLNVPTYRTATVNFLSYLGSVHWKDSNRNALEPLLTSSMAAMSAGYAKDAFFAFHLFATLSLDMGFTSLESLEMKMRTACTSTFCDDEYLMMYERPQWQAVLNLMGQSVSRQAHILKGEALDQVSFVNDVVENNYECIMFEYRLLRLQLSYMFGANDVCMENMEWIEKNGKLWEPFARSSMIYLHQGLLYLKRMRHNRKRKDLATVKKLLKKLEDQGERGNPNAVPVLDLLKAERLASRSLEKRDITSITEAYEQAIESARHYRSIKLEALANERAWAALLDCRSLSNSSVMEESSAELHLRRAIALYARWGATAKVETLTVHHQSNSVYSKGTDATAAIGSTSVSSARSSQAGRSRESGAYVVRNYEDSMASPAWC